jgi:hypothetical protein
MLVSGAFHGTTRDLSVEEAEGYWEESWKSLFYSFPPQLGLTHYIDLELYITVLFYKPTHLQVSTPRPQTHTEDNKEQGY